MKQKRFLALLTGCAMLFGFSGCRGNAEEGASDTEQVTGQTTASTESEVETESKYKKEYDEEGNLYLINKNTDEIIPPFPEGWSGERISKMVTIDGYQLTLPCKVSDILELSEDFRLDEDMQHDYGDGRSFYQIWYKDFIAANGNCRSDNNQIMYINIYCDADAEIEGINLAMPEEVFKFFKDFPKVYSDFINVRYVESDTKYTIQYSRANSNCGVLVLFWEEI